MKSLRTFFGASLFSLLTLLAPFESAQAAPPVFSITTFNIVGDFESSYIGGLNAQGDVVGSGGSSENGWAAFVYSGGTLTVLPQEGTFDSATAINDGGQIVGPIAFVPSRYNSGSNTWTPLSSDPDVTDVYAINNSGVSVGQIYTENGRQALRYNADGSITNLGTLRADGTGASCAVDINAAGAMVGCSDTEDFETHAVLFTEDGTIIDLGTLAGPTGYSEAYGINDLGQIVGQSSNAQDEIRGFIWTEGLFTEIGILGDYEYSEAYGINNLGHAVGRLATYDGYSETGFYFDGTTLWDLADLIQGGLAGAGLSSIFNATAINDAGQIIGDGFDLEGNRVAFLLNVVPEPSTWALLIFGGVGLLVARVRKSPFFRKA